MRNEHGHTDRSIAWYAIGRLESRLDSMIAMRNALDEQIATAERELDEVKQTFNDLHPDDADYDGIPF